MAASRKKPRTAHRRASRRRTRTARGANRATIIVFSGDLDRVMSALIVANGAAAVGMEVSLFFTFSGLGALRRGTRLNLGGVGAKRLRTMMKRKGVASPEELLALARESGVRLVACTTSMDVMGLSPKDLVPDVEIGGVATYLGDAADSRITLFI